MFLDAKSPKSGHSARVFLIVLKKHLDSPLTAQHLLEDMNTHGLWRVS